MRTIHVSMSVAVFSVPLRGVTACIRMWLCAISYTAGVFSVDVYDILFVR